MMKRLFMGAMATLLAAINSKPNVWKQQPAPFDDPDPEDEDELKQARQSFAQMSARHNNAQAAGEELFRENYQLRQQRKELRTKVKDLEGKLPEGSIVLTKEQAADWEAYGKLGKPADVQKLLDDGKTASEKVAGIEKGQVVGDAAKIANMHPEVLKKLVAMDSLEVVVKEIELEGKKQQAVYVKNAAGVETGVADYAKNNWGEFATALAAQPGNGQQQQQGQQQNNEGTNWAGGGGMGNQGGGQGSGSAGSIVDQMLGVPVAPVANNGGGQGGNQQQQQQAPAPSGNPFNPPRTPGTI